MPNHYQLSSITYPPSKRDGEWANQQENNKQQQQILETRENGRSFNLVQKNKTNKTKNQILINPLWWFISFLSLNLSVTRATPMINSSLPPRSNEKQKIKIFLNAPTGYYLILWLREKRKRTFWEPHKGKGEKKNPFHVFFSPLFFSSRKKKVFLVQSFYMYIYIHVISLYVIIIIILPRAVREM